MKDGSRSDAYDLCFTETTAWCASEAGTGGSSRMINYVRVNVSELINMEKSNVEGKRSWEWRLGVALPKPRDQTNGIGGLASIEGNHDGHSNIEFWH